MQVKLIQTCDPFVYHELFSITSRVNREFCKLRDVDYLGYVGLRVGKFPWHATYNRILLLDDTIRQGCRGWVIYLDADAYVADVRFDIRSFLVQHSRFSIIAAPAGLEHWCINAGILLLNLESEFVRVIISKWNEAFQDQIEQEKLMAAAQPWQDGIKDDQVLLHEVLSAENIVDEVLVAPLAQIGAPSSTCFRQILRQNGSLRERCEMARQDTSTLHFEQANMQIF
jgi:hypothetical protein